MSTMRFNYRSQAIGKYVDVTVVYPTDNLSYYDPTEQKKHHILPNEKKKMPYKQGMKFQTIYLIHGGGDDDSLTYRYTNAERYAQENNVMLVTPNVANSFGVNTNYGVEYSTFITQELPKVVQSLFASSEKREDNFIVGYAMGGNVALANALIHPEVYNTCVDISGGIGMTVNTDTLKRELDSDHFKNNFPLYNSTFGKSEMLEESKHNLYRIAKKNLDEGIQVPDFHIIVGSDEFIFDRVKADADTMKEIGYKVEYTCYDGYDHDFVFWDMILKKLFDEILPLKREPIYK
ncbi:MAG: alpha/beta hydrolase-fold protein [Eubacteriales bacterium]